MKKLVVYCGALAILLPLLFAVSSTAAISDTVASGASDIQVMCGAPFVDITNVYPILSYDVTGVSIAGTNNTDVTGTMRWRNADTGIEGTFAAAASWKIPKVALAVGANHITVTGCNAWHESDDDTITVIRGCIGTGKPFVDITNVFPVLSDAVTSVPIAGTNNIHVMGKMWWRNADTGIEGTFSASASWSIPSVALAVGANHITVSGSNYWNQTTSDTITVTCSSTSTNKPLVDITNVYPVLSYDVTGVPIAGTNNSKVVGMMWWRNADTGIEGTFSASASWSLPGVALAVGANHIAVSGSNYWNQTTNDTITVARGGIGTGMPFVDITNVYPLPYDVTSVPIAGSNNLHVMGMMWWRNADTGVEGTMPATASWSIPNIALTIGVNRITVSGSNYWNQTTNDTIMVMRGGIGTGMPFVDITNVYPVLSYDVTSVPIAGSNNIHVMGSMWWRNADTGDEGTMLATASWSIAAIPLAVGANRITVSGSNYWNLTTNDTITVTRGGIGTGMPFVDITNVYPLLYNITSVPIAGSNNIHVMGMMWWRNADTGDEGMFAASASWSIPGVALTVGVNRITVSGSNYWNQTVNDTITVTRGGIGTGMPFVDITNSYPTLSYHVKFVPLAGTNNIHVMGDLWWTNLTLGSGGPVTRSSSHAWTIDNVTLSGSVTEATANQIVVYGTNYLDVVAQDLIIINVEAYNGIPSNSVLCTWPLVIGVDQTGTVEFISTMDTPYRLVAMEGSNEQMVAEGWCAAGWNLVPFHSGRLPYGINEGTNMLVLRLGDDRFGTGEAQLAGDIIMMPDLLIDRRLYSPEPDGDLVNVRYVSKTGHMIARGRTLYVTGGSPKDRLIVRVKRTISQGDGICRIVGIITDGGFSVIKTRGDINKLQADGVVRYVSSYRGSFGQQSRTKLHDIRFNSMGRSSIKTMYGNVYGNILVGTVTNEPGFNGILSTNGTIPVSVAARQGLRMLATIGGNIGNNGIPRWVNASFINVAMARLNKNTRKGGEVVDYSCYLTGMATPGSKGYSLKTLFGNMIVDTSGSNANTTVVCGFDGTLDPLVVTNWAEQNVNYTVRTLAARELLQGTYVINRYPNKIKATKNNDAHFIVNGQP